MANVVNLRQARKRKERSEKGVAAAANRLQHGRSADEKKRSAGLRGLAEKRLDAHRRRPPKEDGREQ